MQAVTPQVHEAQAKLLFADEEDPDDPGLSRYRAIVSQYDRAYDLHEAGSTFEAAGDTWQISHDPEDDDVSSISHWEGKLAAEGEDFDAFYEYQIPVVAIDDTGERKATFQFRPAFPNATNVDNGEPIRSLPDDLPEGLRIQVLSANVDPDEYIPILEALFRELDINTEYLDDVHPWSRVVQLAMYVRLNREVSEEHITDRNGLLERLARFSSVRRGQGEYKWDNEEIMGHRNAVTMNPTSLEKFYTGHAIGKLFKSYHMKNPTEDQGSVTYHPKFELQWNKEYSPETTAAWHTDAPMFDQSDLREELQTALYHGLSWASLPLECDPDVYEADGYFSLDSQEVDIEIVDDPTEELLEYEQTLTVGTLIDADLTDKQRDVVRTVTDGAGDMPVDATAREAGVSPSTVRRTVRKLNDILRISAGSVGPEDPVIASKLKDVFASIETVLEQAKNTVPRLTGRDEIVSKDSPLGKWARRYAVTVDDAADFEPVSIEIAINLGELSRYQIIKIVRSGYQAAQESGRKAAERFRNARISYTDDEGEDQSALIHHYGHDPRILGSSIR